MNKNVFLSMEESLKHKKTFIDMRHNRNDINLKTQFVNLITAS